jgi:hypothetical protein
MNSWSQHSGPSVKWIRNSKRHNAWQAVQTLKDSDPALYRLDTDAEGVREPRINELTR